MYVTPGKLQPRIALLCFALLCFALLCFALLCFALLCFALLYSTLAILCTIIAVAAPPPLQIAATPYSPGFN
jgi:hypothetical protein